MKHFRLHTHLFKIQCSAISPDYLALRYNSPRGIDPLPVFTQTNNIVHFYRNWAVVLLESLKSPYSSNKISFISTHLKLTSWESRRYWMIDIVKILVDLYHSITTIRYTNYNLEMTSRLFFSTNYDNFRGRNFQLLNVWALLRSSFAVRMRGVICHDTVRWDTAMSHCKALRECSKAIKDWGVHGNSVAVLRGGCDLHLLKSDAGKRGEINETHVVFLFQVTKYGKSNDSSKVPAGVYRSIIVIFTCAHLLIF